ncbi:Do family serine endopeptidase [Chthonobacter albigriseus]|uniref:Do family serine endopeptidase n=1 Tax=Chthonobacter albigriseus TaxID=1683161 RepID=UPI0015EF9658|nr:Do family serine endopeptidase [Chthonobacter albigriseus]
MSLDNPSNRTGKSAFRKTLLAGVVAGVVGGAVAGQVIGGVGTPAFAQNLSAAIQQPLSFADVVEKVQPAVVSIRAKTPEAAGDRVTGIPNIPPDHPLNEFFRRFGQPGQPGQPGMPGMPGGPGGRGEGPGGPRFAQAQGSGFIISADGYVVTNNHVVENAEEVTVVLTDGEELSAKVIGTDPKTDLALLKIDEERQFPHVAFSKGDTRVGDWVVAVGNPFGLGGTVTAGIVSARGRDIGAGPYDDFIQIDASINKGNSGGPAFNLTGEVIGVNTAIFSPSGGSVGIGFAIPAATAETVIRDLMDDGKVVRGWLGVQIQPVTDDLAASLGLESTKGALVTQPQSGSPATKAGIRAGDTILSVNGQPVNDARELARTIAGYAPDTVVDVEIWRDSAKRTVKVELGTLPDEQQRASIEPETGPASLEGYGLSLAPASASGAGEAGVVVTDLDPDGKAAEKGIRQGDIILEVAGRPVSAPRDVEEGLKAAADAGRKAVLLRVQSGDDVRFVALGLA